MVIILSTSCLCIAMHVVIWLDRFMQTLLQATPLPQAPFCWFLPVACSQMYGHHLVPFLYKEYRDSHVGPSPSWNIRVGRLSMQGWHRRTKLYNFTTNTQKAYLSIQASSLSAFVISKTHISGQKPRGRQLNAKVCDSKSAIFRLLLSLFRPLVKQR